MHFKRVCSITEGPFEACLFHGYRDPSRIRTCSEISWWCPGPSSGRDGTRYERNGGGVPLPPHGFLAGTLVLTVSSAWLGAGVLLTALGLLTMRQRGGRLSVQLKRPVPVIFVITGVILFTMTLAGLLLPMSG